jgi:DNA-binding response OmpR family regulator
VSETTILIIDDHKTFLKQVEKHLSSAGFSTVSAPLGSSLAEQMKNAQTAAAVIHYMPPVEQTLDMVRAFKKNVHGEGRMLLFYSETLVKTADVVAALEAGVDDYLAYPFDWRVFAAHVKALIRRATFQQEAAQEWLKYKEIKVNPGAHIAQVANKTINLTPKEFDLLCLFMHKKGRVLNRAFLMESVWDYSYFGTTRTVDKHVENLRNKLGKSGQYIETVDRVGYKLK